MEVLKYEKLLQDFNAQKRREENSQRHVLVRAEIQYRPPKEIRIRYSMKMMKEEKTTNEFERKIYSKLQFCSDENVEKTWRRFEDL